MHLHAQGSQAAKTNLTRVKLHSDPSFPHLSCHLLRIVLHSVCNRHDAALHRGQPQGKSPSAVFYQDAKEALYGAKDGTMHHDGLLLVVALVCVLLQLSKHSGIGCCLGPATTEMLLGAETLCVMLAAFAHAQQLQGILT